MSVSVTNGTMTVNHDGSASVDEIAAKVTALGYKASAQSTGALKAQPKVPAKPKRWWQSGKGQMMLACGGGLVVA